MSSKLRLNASEVGREASSIWLGVGQKRSALLMGHTDPNRSWGLARNRAGQMTVEKRICCLAHAT